MKMIPLGDVKKLGKEGDIVEVNDGYGGDSLLNKNLAIMATKKSMEILDEQNLQHGPEEKQKEADVEDLKKQLAEITLEFRVEAGEGGHVFGSASAKQTVARLHEAYRIRVDKKRVTDNDAITSLGYTDVKVDLYRNRVIGTIRAHMNG